MGRKVMLKTTPKLDQEYRDACCTVASFLPGSTPNSNPSAVRPASGHVVAVPGVAGAVLVALSSTAPADGTSLKLGGSLIPC